MTQYGSKELAESFRTVRRNTIQIAEDIPEDKYTFRPTPDCRSVAEVLAHIAVATHYFHDTHAIRKLTNFDGYDWRAHMQRAQAEERALQSKAQILEALRATGEAWAAFLDGVQDADMAEVVRFSPAAVPPQKTRFEMLLSVKEHEMHHRGQLMVIERMLGVTPHLTRQRQERLAQMQAST